MNDDEGMKVRSGKDEVLSPLLGNLWLASRRVS